MKYAGIIGVRSSPGYSEDSTKRGIYYEDILYKFHYLGDVKSTTYRYSGEDQYYPNTEPTTTISILADKKLVSNYNAIEYVELFGVLYRVKTAQVKPPRLILYLGGPYYGYTEQYKS